MAVPCPSMAGGDGDVGGVVEEVARHAHLRPEDVVKSYVGGEDAPGETNYDQDPAVDSLP